MNFNRKLNDRLWSSTLEPCMIISVALDNHQKYCKFTTV